MARYPLGGPVRVRVPVLDTSGAPATATTLTLVVKLAQADGTSLVTGTYTSLPNDSPGLYHQDVPAADLSSAGHYQWAATATGPGAGVSFGEFDVFDPFEVAVLPLQDAFDALNIRTVAAQQANASEIQQYVATITSCLEAMTGGPLVNRVITERCVMTAGQTVILVRQRPLVSVTQILGAGNAPVDISAGLDLDVNAGVIRRRLGLPFFGPFFSWLPQCTVVYVAGWGVAVPAAFNTASRIILQNLWETQHGPSGRPSMGGGDDMVTLPGFGFAVPNQAAELLDGSQDGVPFMAEAFV